MSESITCVRLPNTKTKYTGSRITYEMVKRQIEQRFGQEMADKYDPLVSVRPFQDWIKLGYKVKQGEKGLRSLIFLERRDEKNGITRRFPKVIWLFHECQVESLNQN